MAADTRIFSIDVDAHLKKAASHTFGSPAHYPVELVRAALRRGASQVDILLSRNKLRVQDNGGGLNEDEIDTLHCIMNPQHPIEAKEAAVESLQTRVGMGLLAIFAPNPQEIQIENSSSFGSVNLLLRGAQYRRFAAPKEKNPAPGTVINLSILHRDMETEKHLLEAFCRTIPNVDHIQVKLNGQLLGGHHLLSRQLVIVKLPGTENSSTGQLGIPQQAMICHIRLLEHGIPWHHFTIPTQQGFVFDAAIETTEDISQETVDYFCDQARRLYSWLGQRYSKADPIIQERIEELLFNHCRLTNDESLIEQFSPFRVLNSSVFLDLQQVKHAASQGTLFGVPLKNQRMRYHRGDKTVLVLTREQADLLINHLNLSISFLTPLLRRSNPRSFVRSGFYNLKKWLKRLFLSCWPKPSKILETGQLSKGEVHFLVAVLRDITRGRTGSFSSSDLHGSMFSQVLMVESRGPFPSVPVIRKDRERKEGQLRRKRILLIRRRHPLVIKAVQAVRTDPHNIELFLPLLLPPCD